MDEKKLFNFKKEMKGFDPTAKGSGPRLLDLPLNGKLTQQEQDEYNAAREECEKRGGDWKSERSKEHDRVAGILHEAYKEYDRRYDQ